MEEHRLGPDPGAKILQVAQRGWGGGVEVTASCFPLRRFVLLLLLLVKAALLIITTNDIAMLVTFLSCFVTYKDL